MQDSCKKAKMQTRETKRKKKQIINNCVQRKTAHKRIISNWSGRGEKANHCVNNLAKSRKWHRRFAANNKKCKSEQYASKNHEAIAKTTAKNKVIRRLHILSQNATDQANKLTQTVVSYT